MAECYRHYSEKPLTCIESIAQVDGAAHGNGKPCGLWFSVDSEREDGWPEWCKAEEWCAIDSYFVTDLDLDLNRFVRISSAAALRLFHEDFWIATKPYRVLGNIDWKRVAAEHSGIIIAPLLYDCRFDPEMNWYYGWDCASGCVWDASAVRIMARDEVLA